MQTRQRTLIPMGSPLTVAAFGVIVLAAVVLPSRSDTLPAGKIHSPIDEIQSPGTHAPSKLLSQHPKIVRGHPDAVGSSGVNIQAQKGSAGAQIGLNVDDQKRQDRGKVVRGHIEEYSTSRYNALLDGDQVISALASDGKANVEAIHALLLNTKELQALPENTRFAHDRPAIVMERMAMIDVLEKLAGTEPAAVDALVDLALMSLDDSLPKHVIRAILGEKYDAFAVLARVDWTVARDTFVQVKDNAMKTLLRGALVRGLMDAGLSGEEATRMAGDL